MSEAIPAIRIEAEAGRDLGQLATAINEAHQQCETAVKMGLRLALEAGQLLNAVRKRVPPGEWGRWLEGHVAFSEATARRYMRLDRERVRLADWQHAANLTIREALRLLADPTTDDQADEEPAAPTGAVLARLTGQDLQRLQPPARHHPAEPEPVATPSANGLPPTRPAGDKQEALYPAPTGRQSEEVLERRREVPPGPAAAAHPCKVIQVNVGVDVDAHEVALDYHKKHNRRSFSETLNFFLRRGLQSEGLMASDKA